MKKVPIHHNTKIEDLMLNVDRAPNYLGLKFVGFKFVTPANVEKTTNHPRMVEKKSGNCDTISASLKKGWTVGSFPPSFVLEPDKTRLLNGRHTLDAFIQNQYHVMPAAIYVRVESGDKDFDALSDECQDMINGTRANVDGTCNTVKDDFQYVANQVILTDKLDRNVDVIEQILDWCNIHERYNYSGTIKEIRNKVLDLKGKTSQKVFNTTKEESTYWMSNNRKFGENNYSEDGYRLRSTSIKKESNLRDYAHRIIDSAYDAVEKDCIERRIIWSTSTNPDQIKLDRQKLVNTVYDCHNIPRDYFNNFIKSELEKIPFFENISLPNCELGNLPLELWAGPQIDGETEAIRLI
jgi:hypothetical protein